MENFIFLCTVTKRCQNSSSYWSISGQYFSSLIPLKHCVKSVQIRSFFWPAFSRIRTEYGEILSRRIQSECGKMRIRKNSVFEHFSRNDTTWYFSDIFRKYRKGTLIKTRVWSTYEELGNKRINLTEFCFEVLINLWLIFWKKENKELSCFKWPTL